MAKKEIIIQDVWGNQIVLLDVKRDKKGRKKIEWIPHLFK
tara:strand:- start:842 stop:961 length:120 start_codon:yes stop_codon:yes gene_type:complete